MLWRALGSIEHGLYIDVGAQDPAIESVSRLFHEAGWRGVHVEPHPEYAALLRAARPADCVIQAAVAPEAGLASFCAFAGTGLSTAVESVAARHIDNGYAVERLTVPCVTLDMIFAECAGEDIHWLKLDVEGFERAALEGWHSDVRPWIVVVEAVEVGGRAPTHEAFDALLFAKGYHVAYFDGLNRFYVSDAYPELDAHFAFGPSMWDDILVAPEGQMARVLRKLFDERIGEAEQALRDREADLASLAGQADALRGQVDALRVQLASVEAEKDRASIAAAETGRLQARHARLRLAFARRGDALGLSQQQLATLADAQKALVAELERMRRERNGAREAEAAVRQAAADRQEALTQGAQELRQLDQRLQESRGEVERLQRTSEEMRGRMTFLLGRLETIAAGPPRDAHGQAHQALTMVPVVLPGAPASAEGPARSVRALLGAGDSLFIDACFRTLLGRPADPAGSAFYLGQLHDGKSREAVLRDIARSAEARSHGADLAGLAAFLRSRRGRGGLAPGLKVELFWGTSRSGDAAGTAQVARLFTLPEQDFIPDLYGTVLGRGPRADEASGIAAGLAAGDDRLTLLSRLRWSREGRRLKVPASLARRTNWYRGRDWPILGALLEQRAFARWAAGLNAMRRGIEARLALVEDGLSEQRRKRVPRNHTVWAGATPPPGEQSIWYCGPDAGGEPQLHAGLPETLEAIACADPARARTTIDAGVGRAVRPVGTLLSGNSGPAAEALTQLMVALDASRPARLAFAGRRLKIAMLTTWNAKCGIATHSNELVETFEDVDVEILAPASDEPLVADAANVRRLWRKEKAQSDLGKVLDHLAANKPDMLVVQFNFAFFEHGELDHLLKSAAAIGIVTMVIMHTTTDPQNAPGFHVHEIVGGLTAASRVIVHNAEDVANLAALGIVDNVLRLPHGVRRGRALDVRSAPGERPVLATFGFCFPNKGLVEIVKAIRLLKDGGTPVRLRMFNALHPDSSSLSTLRAVKAAISALKLDDDVELYSEFLDLDLVDREIAHADLFVNPYQTTSESASGAVRIGLRNKVPTLVTPLAIFDELGDVVSRAPGRRPQDLAAGIRSALEEAGDPVAAEERQARIEDWLAEHDFRQQSVRLANISRTFRLQMMLEGTH